MTIHLYSIFFTFFIFININSSYNQQTAQKIYFCGGLAAGLSHQVHTQKKIPGFLSQKNSGFIIKVIKEIEKQKLYEKLLYSALTAYDVKENYFSLTGKKFEYYFQNAIGRICPLSDLSADTDGTSFVIIQEQKEESILQKLFLKKYHIIYDNYKSKQDEALNIILSEKSCTIQNALSQYILLILKNIFSADIFFDQKNKYLLREYDLSTLETIKNNLKTLKADFLNNMALMLFKKSADQIKRDFNVYGETSEHHLVSNFIRNLLKELNINTISEFLTIVLKIKNEYENYINNNFDVFKEYEKQNSFFKSSEKFIKLTTDLFNVTEHFDMHSQSLDASLKISDLYDTKGHLSTFNSWEIVMLEHDRKNFQEHQSGAHMKDSNNRRNSIAIITTNQSKMSNPLLTTILNDILLFPHLYTKHHIAILSKNLLIDFNLMQTIKAFMGKIKNSSEIQFFVPDKEYDEFKKAVKAATASKFSHDTINLMSINEMIEEKYCFKSSFIKKVIREKFTYIFDIVNSEMEKKGNFLINFLLTFDTPLLSKDIVEEYLLTDEDYNTQEINEEFARGIIGSIVKEATAKNNNLVWFLENE